LKHFLRVNRSQRRQLTIFPYCLNVKKAHEQYSWYLLTLLWASHGTR
jgi:hypothetical protein